MAGKKKPAKNKTQSKTKSNLKQYKKECFRDLLSSAGNILFLLSLGVCGYICHMLLFMCIILFIPLIFMTMLFIKNWTEYFRLCRAYYEKSFHYKCNECGEEYEIPFKYLKQEVNKLQKNKQGRKYKICDFCGRHIYVPYQNELERYEEYLRKTEK